MSAEKEELMTFFLFRICSMLFALILNLKRILLTKAEYLGHTSMNSILVHEWDEIEFSSFF